MWIRVRTSQQRKRVVKLLGRTYRRGLRALAITTRFVPPLDRFASRLAALPLAFYRKRLSSIKGFRCAYASAFGAESCSDRTMTLLQSLPLSHAIVMIDEQFARCREASSLLNRSRPIGSGVVAELGLGRSGLMAVGLGQVLMAEQRREPNYEMIGQVMEEVGDGAAEYVKQEHCGDDDKPATAASSDCDGADSSSASAAGADCDGGSSCD
jgi:putative component of membrane protein insertase Oxa1/YidC/SpoIIIJ protein YidD